MFPFLNQAKQGWEFLFFICSYKSSFYPQNRRNNLTVKTAKEMFELWVFWWVGHSHKMFNILFYSLAVIHHLSKPKGHIQCFTCFPPNDATFVVKQS